VVKELNRADASNRSVPGGGQVLLALFLLIVAIACGVVVGVERGWVWWMVAIGIAVVVFVIWDYAPGGPSRRDAVISGLARWLRARRRPKTERPRSAEVMHHRLLQLMRNDDQQQFTDDLSYCLAPGLSEMLGDLRAYAGVYGALVLWKSAGGHGLELEEQRDHAPPANNPTPRRRRCHPPEPRNRQLAIGTAPMSAAGARPGVVVKVCRGLRSARKDALDERLVLLAELVSVWRRYRCRARNCSFRFDGWPASYRPRWPVRP
jgi:hypothetical protein